MAIEKLSGKIIEGYDGSGYKKYDKLTADEFNKVPRKVNEIITYVNNISAIDDIDLEELANINEKVNNNLTYTANNSESINNLSYSLDNTITKLEDTIEEMHNLPTNISQENIDSSIITNIDNYSEIKLGLNAFGQICLIKNDDISVNIELSKQTFEIDEIITEPIEIYVNILQGQDRVTDIKVTTSDGILNQINSNKWILGGITTDTDITVTINNRKTYNAKIMYNMTKSAYLWSPLKLYTANFRRPQMMDNIGFYVPDNAISNLDNNQKYWYSQHPDRKTPMYFYIVTSTYVSEEELRTRFFLYNSSISGGMDYIGQITQYSTNIPYYIYKTNDKIDTSITVQIQ